MEKGMLLQSAAFDNAALARTLDAFLFLRAYLVVRFGVPDETQAQGAITTYLGTFDQELVQIHVGTSSPLESLAPSFLITFQANASLVEAGFYRLRYKALGETGQYQNPVSPRVIRVWGTPDMLSAKVKAVLFATTTQIGDRLDSTTFFMVRWDVDGQPRLYRSYLLECAPDGNAWMLGNGPLSPAVLPGIARLAPSGAVVQRLVDLHDELISGSRSHPFVHGQSHFRTGEGFLRYLAQESMFSARGPEALAAHLDGLLMGQP